MYIYIYHRLYISQEGALNNSLYLNKSLKTPKLNIMEVCLSLFDSKFKSSNFLTKTAA